ncbi:tyrosine-type recombinase/integrase [Shewanella mangrovisoli]|uniref:Tyrosine-type recombinase/integrase n=1 Tax=Shewanella mangrovisoli TaxID=2864211 RepID=A0ABV4VNE1_9GAMM
MLQDVLQTETRKIPHTYLRNGIYYLRYRVPRVVQDMTGLPAVLRQSLNTRSPDVALEFTRIVVSKICELKGVVMARNLETSLKMHFSMIKTIYGDVVIHDENDAVEARKVRTFMVENDDIIVKNHSVIPNAQACPSNVDLSLSEAICQYMSWRENRRNKDGSLGLTASAKNARMRNFDLLLLILGDISIHEVTKFKLRHLLDRISNMPRRNKRPYYKWTLEEAVEAARVRCVPEDDLVASKQAKEALKDYQSLFSRYLTDEMGWLQVAPTAGVRVEFESLSYASFSHTQISQVVDYWKSQPCPDYKWIMLLGIYTGARRGDLFNLKISSVRYDKSCDRFFLLIEKGKNENAERMIPLHKSLFEEGFVRFYKAKKSSLDIEEKLFGDVKVDNYITSKFRLSLDTIGIPKTTPKKRRYSFHSLRHTVVTKARSQDISLAKIQTVIGHELSEGGTTDIYTNEFELKDLLCVIDCLDW